MERVLRLVIGAARAGLRALSTPRQQVSWPEKGVRGVLLIPVFGVLLVLLRAWAWMRGPLVVRTATRSGARVECRLPDFIQTYLYIFGVWEPDVSAFISSRLRPGDTFVDVGANIGYHTLLAANEVGSEGRVVAIESSPKIYRLLQNMLALNGSPAAVRTVNRAASDTVCELTLYEGPDKNIGLSTTVGSRGLPSEGTIAAAPLADLLEPEEIANARLVKIDVEGAEVAVMRGMNSFLEQCPPDVELVIELSPLWWVDRSQSPQEVLEPFLAAGFHPYEIDNNLWPWRYLWPEAVRRPRRVRRPLAGDVKRHDLVLSRIDADEL